MKKLLFLFIILMLSCSEEEICICGLLNQNQILKNGPDLEVEGTYNNLDADVTFTVEEKSDGPSYCIKVTEVDTACILRSILVFNDISSPVIGDTIKLRPLTIERLGNDARYFITNDDDVIERYDIIDDNTSYLIIHEINQDTTAIEGTFDVHLVTSDLTLLWNEVQRTDDPMRPNYLSLSGKDFEATLLP
jgi:hypothetical protein